ncbi:MAG TPA: sulfatase [Phycisphaerae bacterium]|nr:sulfatase [Phycisphaerae bacterium]HRY69920.1 sulfatase [Phycisphaerae bacterium]HSA27129.1 sulfatase [Phycisphaerae bacterium]
MKQTLPAPIVWLNLVTVALAGAASQPEGGAQAGASRRPKPNLIFVLADQLRYQSCSFAGDSRARTPNIDRLASQSVVFRNAISGHPVCAPYRASLFTGKYTTSTGMVINELRMNPNHECLAHVLTRHGYDTAYIGKWHLWANELGNHYEPKNSFTPPGPYRLGFDGFWAAYNFHHEYYKAYYHTNSPEKIPVKGYEPDFQTEMAAGLVDRFARSEKPFALFLSVGTPHDPWAPDNVPPEYYAMFADEGDTPRFALPPNYKPENDPYADDWGRYKGPDERRRIPAMMRGYYAMTANLDWNLGRLLKAIDDAGIRDNTILVFTSDHGEMMGAQGRRAKNIFYEEAIRVPFLVRWPGKTPAGQSSDACLNTPDIMPTLLAMAGLPIPAKVEGTDLSPCAFGRPGPEPEAAFLQNTGACAIWQDGYEWRALRDKRYTYAIYRKDRKELLFDHVADPHQLRNLVTDAEQAPTLDRFRTLLKKRMSELDDTFEASSWYRDHWVKDRIINRVR